MIVQKKRHIAKTISYRIISTLIGFIIMWFISGSIKIGAAFGVVELCYKPLQYYIHERVWYRWIKFGLKEEKKNKQDGMSGYNYHHESYGTGAPMHSGGPVMGRNTTSGSSGMWGTFGNINNE